MTTRMGEREVPRQGRGKAATLTGLLSGMNEPSAAITPRATPCSTVCPPPGWRRPAAGLLPELQAAAMRTAT